MTSFRLSPRYVSGYLEDLRALLVGIRPVLFIRASLDISLTALPCTTERDGQETSPRRLRC